MRRHDFRSVTNELSIASMVIRYPRPIRDSNMALIGQNYCILHRERNTRLHDDNQMSVTTQLRPM